MRTEIKTIRFTRNGRDYQMNVQVKWNTDEFAWIKREDGKPFFGTTGYFWATPGKWGRNDPTIISSYRGKVLAENVTGIV